MGSEQGTGDRGQGTGIRGQWAAVRGQGHADTNRKSSPAGAINNLAWGANPREQVAIPNTPWTG